MARTRPFSGPMHTNRFGLASSRVTESFPRNKNSAARCRKERRQVATYLLWTPGSAANAGHPEDGLLESGGVHRLIALELGEVRRRRAVDVGLHGPGIRDSKRRP